MSTIRPQAQVPPALLAAVRECPQRGSVLPVSQQPPCGCAEFTACRAGRGQRPGQVTLSECLVCRSEALGLGEEGEASEDHLEGERR